MKAQTYYRCKNCSGIKAKDAGKPLSSCPDCGREDFQVLVPVDDEMKTDPLSGRKKAALTALVAFAGIASVTVFLLFGQLLQGYMTFDARREATEKTHESLTTKIQAQEATLSTLTKKAAEEIAQATANVRVIETSANAAKAELAEAETAVHRERLTLSNETIRVAGIRTELAELEKDRNILTRKVDALAAEEARLSVAVEAAMTRTNRLAFQLAATEKAQASANTELLKSQTALDLANAARDKAKEQTEAQTARLTTLATRKEALESDIRDRERTQATLDAAITELKKQHGITLTEATKTRAALDTLNSARDKAREDTETLSARAAILKADVAALERTKTDAEKAKGVTGK